MKQSLSVLFFFLFSLSLSSFAQEQSIDLTKEITINLQGQTLDSVISEISKQGDINFSFSHDLIDAKQIIHFNFKAGTVEDAIKALAEQVNIKVVFLEKQVILTPPPKDKNKDEKEEEKEYTISGYIKDEQSAEILIGASIYIPEIENGTVTNGYGFFSLTLPKGQYTFQISSLGYGSQIVKIDMTEDQTLDFDIKSDYTELATVEISALEQEENNQQNYLDDIQLIPTKLTGLMNNFGEVEVIKSLQSIPGISTQGDGSVFFHVRGGNKDQNLILLDEAPIYNPSHLLGFFSSFSPDAIKNVNVYKSEVPASLGGMLSSVIDIKTKDGNLYKRGGYASISPFTTSLSLEGPIFAEKVSYYTSWRRSHLDWLIRNEDQYMHFRDFNLKLNYKINENNRLFMTVYNGSDYFGDVPTKIGNSGIAWGNRSFTFRWNHLFSDKLFSNTTFYRSRYNYYLYLDEDANTYWNEKIESATLKTDFTYFKNDRKTIYFGYKVNGHEFDPGNIVYEGQANLEALPSVPQKHSSSGNMYYSQNRKLGQKFELNLGLRYTVWNNLGPTQEWVMNDQYEVTGFTNHRNGDEYFTQHHLEPRLSLKYEIDSNSFTKASYDRTSQHIHLLSNSLSPFTSLDVWVPSGPNIPAQLADNLTIGYYRLSKNRSYRFVWELYYRLMENQIDFIDHPNLILNPYLETQIRIGWGWAYGSEFSFEKTTGLLRWKTSLNLSKTWREIEGINNDEPYIPYSDRPYDFNFSLAYQKTPKWTWTANYVHMSGLAFTSPIGYYSYQGSLVPYIDEKNNDRLPDYKRLDLGVTMKLNKDFEKRFQHEAGISIYNALWFINPIAINFNKVRTQNGFRIPANYYGEEELVSTSMHLLGIVPSIHYTLRF